MSKVPIEYVVTLTFKADRDLELPDYDKIKEATKDISGVLSNSVCYDMTVLDFNDDDED